MVEFNEIDADFYDLEYFISLEYRYFSGAHRSRINNILKLIGDIVGKRVLDWGCGGGYFCNEFSNIGASVIGVDYSKFAISFAKERYPRIDFRQTSNYLLSDFPKDYFDVVSLIDIIEHVANHQAMIDEIGRVLKSGGILLISTDLDDNIWKRRPFSLVFNFSQYFSRDGRAYKLIKNVESHRKQFKNYHISHINSVSDKYLIDLLRKNNFTIKEYLVYPVVGVPIRDFFIRLLPKKFRGDHQCIVAIKN